MKTLSLADAMSFFQSTSRITPLVSFAIPSPAPFACSWIHLRRSDQQLNIACETQLVHVVPNTCCQYDGPARKHQLPTPAVQSRLHAVPSRLHALDSLLRRPAAPVSLPRATLLSMMREKCSFACALAQSISFFKPSACAWLLIFPSVGRSIGSSNFWSPGALKSWI